jgi:O-antigen/teichoic acid export membrane protein
MSEKSANACSTNQGTGTDKDRSLSRRSLITYLALSLGAALVFLAAALLKGGYAPVALYGGALWVFLLSLIVSMPLATSWWKRRLRRRRSERTSS